MQQEQPLAFYERRAREERARAGSANDDRVVLSHLAMAFAYETLLDSPYGIHDTRLSAARSAARR